MFHFYDAAMGGGGGNQPIDCGNCAVTGYTVDRRPIFGPGITRNQLCKIKKGEGNFAALKVAKLSKIGQHL